MKARVVLIAAIVAAAFGTSAGHATAGTQIRYCPLPVIGGDPDRVSVSGPIAGPANGKVAYEVKVDESVGEGSHVVAGAFIASSSDGGSMSVAEAAGQAPAVGTLTLDAGHAYTVQWVTTFDYGIHPCSSAEPDQTPFSISA